MRSETFDVLGQKKNTSMSPDEFLSRFETKTGCPERGLNLVIRKIFPSHQPAFNVVENRLNLVVGEFCHGRIITAIGVALFISAPSNLHGQWR